MALGYSDPGGSRPYPLGGRRLRGGRKRKREIWVQGRWDVRRRGRDLENFFFFPFSGVEGPGMMKFFPKCSPAVQGRWNVRCAKKRLCEKYSQSRVGSRVGRA